MLAVASLVLCGILVALHFPVVMNSPLAALAFALLTTGTVGAAAIAVGAQLAPLPLFALILVSPKPRGKASARIVCSNMFPSIILGFASCGFFSAPRCLQSIISHFAHGARGFGTYPGTPENK